MSEKSTFAYDKVLYPNYLHTQTHPDRLATMTRFFGVNSKPVENCRVLELGCGTGSSLQSFAYDLPHSEFIGIDLSEKQIEFGNIAVDALDLRNLTLQQGDIMDISHEKYGEFDYIIAHGLYSWVPDVVRDQILKICRELLAEQGVAFISYNALPGCHYRQMVREMMLFRAGSLTEPIEKVTQSVGFLKFIADSAEEGKPHHSVLRDQLESLTKRKIENIYHDDLTEYNHPVYFYEFVNHAEKHDLQFVTEVKHFPTKDVNYPKEVLETLEGICDNVIELEQYLDFIKGRQFRQSLLCRKELNLSPHPDPKVLREVRIASPLQPESEKPELATKKHERFEKQPDKMIKIDHPLTKAALYHLSRIWTRSTTFDELIETSRKLLSEESGTDFKVTVRDEEVLNDILFQIFCSGMLRLNLHEPVYMTEVSEKPLVSPLARWRSAHEGSVSTLLCTTVAIEDSLGRELIRLLDGTRDRRQLVEDLTAFINSEKYDEPDEIKKNILRDLPERLEMNLASFAHMALLIA